MARSDRTRRLPLPLTVAVCAIVVAASLSAQQPAGAQAAATPLSNLVLRDGSYVIQAGDAISVRVFRQGDLDETVRVRPDGRISIPLLDEMPAAGLTPQELDAKLTAGYAKFFKDPEVSVIVREFAAVKVYVGGEVGLPGPIPVLGELTAAAAVFQAGGFRNSARTDSVILIRRTTGPTPMIQHLNLKAVLTKGAADVPLRPFDVIYVPMSRIAKVDRFVDQYMRQLLPISLTAGFSYILGDSVIVR